MNNNKFLPIGTVVMLNGGSKRLMVSGYLARTDEKVYDYFGILYPEGQIDPEKPLLFDHSQIAQVYNQAFVDQECTDFMAKIAGLDTQLKNGELNISPESVVAPVEPTAPVAPVNPEVIPEMPIETLNDDRPVNQAAPVQPTVVQQPQTIINPTPEVVTSAPVEISQPVVAAQTVNPVQMPTPVVNDSGLAPVQMTVPTSNVVVQQPQTTIF